MALKHRKNRAAPQPTMCPLRTCMAVLSGAWTPNVIWCLSANPRRFNELLADIPGISAKVLTARLRTLEQKGVLTRNVVQTSPPSVEYALTEIGRELMPAIAAIAEVGTKLREARLDAAA
jgi:DNA-binding HxlR family transcriptional regulator